MGIRARTWRRGRTCEAIVELPDGQPYVCGKYTRDRTARCDEHRARSKPSPDRLPQRRKAS